MSGVSITACEAKRLACAFCDFNLAIADGLAVRIVRAGLRLREMEIATGVEVVPVDEIDGWIRAGSAAGRSQLLEASLC